MQSNLKFVYIMYAYRMHSISNYARCFKKVNTLEKSTDCGRFFKKSVQIDVEIVLIKEMICMFTVLQLTGKNYID